MKKSCKLVLFAFCSVLMFFGIFISDIKYNILDNDDELEVNEKILNDLDDLDQFINSYFDVYDSYSYSLIEK